MERRKTNGHPRHHLHPWRDFVRKLCVLAGLSCVPLLLPLAATDASERTSGFRPETRRSESDWESRFRALPDGQVLRQTMERLSAHPHHVGSPYDRENAEWIKSQFSAWGWHAEIETFDVLFPTPRKRLVELVAPAHYVAKMKEPPVQGDPTSYQQSEQLPSYNAYSIDGDVTGPVVYVNYGLPADYKALDSLGVSVSGAIVIARYGKSWRGIKPKLAAEHGAIGCILYSDPREDGYFQSDVFPAGGMRNENSVERGSVLDMSFYPGDPLTPGVGAIGSVKRLDIRDAKTITRIPVLPLSYGDAKPILAAIGGRIAPESFRGALGMTYHVGPGPAKVHMAVESNWDIKPVYDVIAKIAGRDFPDQWVIRGNHHDAWVNGAVDPISGQIALLEEARSIGRLVGQGWQPRRTIVYCAWDGEEPFLLGSTEWAEYHTDTLNRNAAIYVNTDGYGRGYLVVDGSHSLERFVNEVARDINDPETNISVWKRSQARRLLLDEGDENTKSEARTRRDLRIGALGSGSDYTAFIHHLGIPSLNVAYDGEDKDGVYHSVYDDFYWFTHFSDTQFVYGQLLAQTVGTMVLRFADADILPYDFSDFAETLSKYTAELKTLLKHQQDEIRERNRNLDEGMYSAISDPRAPIVPPKKEDEAPFLNFAPLDNSQFTLSRSAARYGKAITQFLSNQDPPSLESLQKLNAQLIEAQRSLISESGLPRRPWYKNLIYAPGYYTGYEAKTFPGIREAIEQRHYKEAEDEVARVAAVLQNYASAIDAVSDQLEKHSQ